MQRIIRGECMPCHVQDILNKFDKTVEFKNDLSQAVHAKTNNDVSENIFISTSGQKSGNARRETRFLIGFDRQ